MGTGFIGARGEGQGVVRKGKREKGKEAFSSGLRKRLVYLLVLMLSLSGCAYTYLPPVREARVPEPRLTIAAASRLGQNETTIRLDLRLVTVPEADWLAVQWFGPNNDEVTAESVWVVPTERPQNVAVSLPPSAVLRDGLWRAVLSYQGRFVRQFSVQVQN